MSITQRLKAWVAQRLITVADLDRMMYGYGEPAATGVRVDEMRAMQTTAVYACVRILAETIATLPVFVYKRNDRGREKVPEHPLYRLLHDEPNPEMTAYTFKESLQGHVALWGNAYAEIEWDTRTGQPRHLWPLRPDRVKVTRGKGKLYYVIKVPGKPDVVLPAYRVLHIPGLSHDGIVGYSPVQLIRESVGLALAAEEYGARYFGNGARPGGVLEHPGRLGQDAADRLRKSWVEMHAGLTNQHRVAILEEGMKYNQVGLPPEDSQFLQTRKFQVEEIARFYRIPPHMIQDLERSTNNNIEHQGIEFVQHTMLPWFSRWEQAVNKKLIIGEDQQKIYYAEFLINALLRGDVESRYRAYAVGRQWGWLSANDIRELENMNPLPEDQGDIYLVPMNMIPAQMALPMGNEQVKPGETESERAERALPEFKQQKRMNFGVNRMKLAQSFGGKIQDAAARMIIREKAVVLKNAKRTLLNGDLDAWQQWLDEYYTRDFPDFVRHSLLPVFAMLADAVAVIAAEEVNMDKPPDTVGQVTEHAQNYAYRYSDSSQGQLRAITRQGYDEGMDDEGVYGEIEQRLDEWEERRPGKVSKDQAIDVANNISKYVFAAAGVTYLIWQNTGNKTCEFCEQMDGKRVGIKEPFLPAGEYILASDGSGMRIYGLKMHPPIHRNCQCVVMPG